MISSKIGRLFFLFFACNIVSLSAVHYKVLITGCGRSGTTFITRFLQKSGLSVGHEEWGPDGCVSWAMAANSLGPWGSNENDTFEHVFHQVRDPLNVITSWVVNIPNLDRYEWVFIRDHVPEIIREDSLIVHCAKYWLYWNILAENKSEWTYRIENLYEVLPELERRLNIVLRPDVLCQLPKNINSWNSTKSKLTWRDLRNELPNDLYNAVRDMAMRYGYSGSD